MQYYGIMQQACMPNQLGTIKQVLTVYCDQWFLSRVIGLITRPKKPSLSVLSIEINKAEVINKTLPELQNMIMHIHKFVLYNEGT